MDIVVLTLKQEKLLTWTFEPSSKHEPGTQALQRLQTTSTLLPPSSQQHRVELALPVRAKHVDRLCGVSEAMIHDQELQCDTAQDL